MKNVNDESPMFEPRSPVVRVKKGAPLGFVVYNLQAFDPDGDGITYSTTQPRGQLIATLILTVIF